MIMKKSAVYCGINQKSIYTKVAYISFFIFLFSVTFGLRLPFRERVTDVNDITTSYLLNQIVFSLLFLMSIFAISCKRNKLLLLIKKEKFLSLFLVWCLLSVIWSDYSFVSFKRLFQFFTTVLVCLAFLSHIDSLDQALKYFKKFFYIYIVISLLTIYLVPGARELTGEWRGLTDGKNLLGQVSLVSIIICSKIFGSFRLNEKVLATLMLIISLLLLIGSKSMTALITFLFILTLWVILSIDKLFSTLGIGRIYFIFIVLSFLGIIITIFFLQPDLIESMPNYLGKDNTFTGRTDLWSDMLEEARRHFILGCGFASFWVIGNENLIYLYEEHIWLPNQAHMGYIDILNETGIVGIIIFLLMVIFYFVNLMKFKFPYFWKWFFIAALIINLQETTLLKPTHLTGVMFIFSYLALYIGLVNRVLSESKIHLQFSLT